MTLGSFNPTVYFGVITAIDEGQINLKEVVQDAGGDWLERSTTVQMSEGKK